MDTQDSFFVKPNDCPSSFCVTVPGSKSITNRALLLAALSNGSCTLSNVLFSEDSRALLTALSNLGFSVTVDEIAKTAVVVGNDGRIPCEEASLHAQSAGTAARFLTAMLSFGDGTYTLTASEQMKKRPMAPLFTALSENGVPISFLEKEGCLPVQIKGIQNSTDFAPDFTINIEKSSQFLSALMLTGGMLKKGLSVSAIGTRSAVSYVIMTQKMMEAFGKAPLSIDKKDTVLSYQIPKGSYRCRDYRIEPDISGACYFYAAALLLGISVTVEGVFPDSIQGDAKFLSVLEQLGAKWTNTPKGICITGPKDRHYPGIDLWMSDFSDQTMTIAVLALFADTPTTIRGISHIRGQESDRIAATIAQIRRLGGIAEELPDGSGFVITPTVLHGSDIETYNDHRMAMAFSLAGLRVDGVRILNPGCCKKTFENYFELFSQYLQN